MQTQRPLQRAAVEAIVLFVRDDVAIASIGHGGAKFVPLVETLFFFILYCNLLGLFPWGATPTGNLAVTGGLALIAFFVIEVSGFLALGPKGYLKTIVMVPAGMTGFGAVIMALIMTPAAFHRHQNAYEVDATFIRVSEVALVASMFPLAIAIGLDLYIVANTIVGVPWAAGIAVAVLLWIGMLWFVLPRSRSLQRALRLDGRNPS